MNRSPEATVDKADSPDPALAVLDTNGGHEDSVPVPEYPGTECQRHAVLGDIDGILRGIELDVYGFMYAH